MIGRHYLAMSSEHFGPDKKALGIRLKTDYFSGTESTRDLASMCPEKTSVKAEWRGQGGQGRRDGKYGIAIRVMMLHRSGAHQL